MKLSQFQTVRGRLIGLLVLIAVPMALLSAVAAVTTYRSVLGSIEDRQLEAVANYSVRTHIWFDGTLRILQATVAGIQAAEAQAEECNAIGQRVLAGVQDYQALRIRFADGTACLASRNDVLSAAKLDAMMSAGAAGAATRNPEEPAARYDYVEIDGKRYFAIHASGDGRTGTGWQALLITEVAALERAFNLGALTSGAVIGLIGRRDEVLIARGDEASAAGWLPATEPIPRTLSRFDGPSRAGATRSYSGEWIAEPNLYVLASLDQTAALAARAQFLALLIIPLATLALLCAVYLRAIHSHILRWLRGIEQAARQEQQSSFTARALVAEEMPSDIKSVARAFNGMVDAQEQRQQALQKALDQNRLLVRELHHRVKNSLQIVQSYLSLAKRNHSAEANLALSEAECRVQVLAIAYRFALAHGEMHPVRVDVFLDEVLATISRLLTRPGQTIDGDITSEVSLPIDRLIPLGLLVVETMSRCLSTEPGVRIAVRVADTGEALDATAFELRLTADRDLVLGPPPKILAGLAAQAEAVQPARETATELATWRVTA